jgi:hypothetical protein
LEGNMVIWWLSTNISTIYTLQIQAFNNQCLLGSKEKKTKICVPTELESASKFVHSKTSTNEQHSHESSSSTPSGMPIIRSTEFVHQIIHCTTGRHKYKKKKQSIY